MIWICPQNTCAYDRAHSQAGKCPRCLSDLKDFEDESKEGRLEVVRRLRSKFALGLKKWIIIEFALALALMGLSIFARRYSVWISNLVLIAASAMILLLISSIISRIIRSRLTVGEDNRYSVSRLQLYLWIFLAITLYSAVAVTRRELAEFPYTLGSAVGISLASVLISKGFRVWNNDRKRERYLRITGKGGTRPPDQTTSLETLYPSLSVAVRPYFWIDLLTEEDDVAKHGVGTLSLMKFQMLAWTIVLILFYLIGFVFSVRASGTGISLGEIHSNLLLLMALSHGAYLVMKLPMSHID